MLNPIPAKSLGWAGCYSLQQAYQISNPSILVGLAHQFLQKTSCTYSNDQILLDKAGPTNATHSLVERHT